MIAGWLERRALKRVFGTNARVASRRELQRRGSRRSLAARLDDGSWWVVKYDRRPERVALEASRLGAANQLAEIDTPRLRGWSRHHLVQEFVPGEGLDAIARRSPGEARRGLFERAAGVLAAIHGSRAALPAGLKLSSPCAPALLAERVRRAWREIETSGFPRWETRGEKLPASWRQAFGEAAASRLIADLSAAGEGCVLGHGDFQPRHLILSPDDRLFVVDWIAMAWLCPWVELAHLLRWLAPAEQEAVTAVYLEAAQKRGLLREVSPARSAALAKSALRYDHLILAKQVVRKLGRTPSPGHLQTFRSSLDALAESAG